MRNKVCEVEGQRVRLCVDDHGRKSKVHWRKGLRVGVGIIRHLCKGDVPRLDFKNTLPFTFLKMNS